MRQWTFGYGSSEGANMEFGVAPLPHFEGATDYKTTTVGGAILSIPSVTTGNAREAALNLTKFLGDETAQEAELTSDSNPTESGVQELSNFPALKSVYDNPPAGFEWISNWTDQLNLTLSRPKLSKYSQVSTVVADYFSDLLSCNKDVEEALSEMQRDVKSILAGPPEEIPGYTLGILILSIVMATSVVAIIKKRK
jgi:ABC-type glycerol-3-phosphate transport system substrate-binding protein